MFSEIELFTLYHVQYNLPPEEARQIAKTHVKYDEKILKRRNEVLRELAQMEAEKRMVLNEMMNLRTVELG